MAGGDVRVTNGESWLGSWTLAHAAPHPELRPHVTRYTGYAESATRPFRRREVPTAGVTLIISFGDPLLLTVPAFRWLWTAHDDYNQHVTRYTRPELRRQAEEQGFVEARSHYFFHWLVAAKLAVRLKEAVAGKGGPAQLPPPAINRAMLAICRLEQRLLGAFPPPLGSSLLYLGSCRPPPAGC